MMFVNSFDAEVPAGYKMWKQILKAITWWSAAIHTALDKYNELVLQQNPPWPILQYSDMASYSWLGNLDLLKYLCSNITQKPWTVPANHEVANKYFKLQHAQEEVEHLNIKVCRLDAWVYHENQAFMAAIQAAADPHPATELCCYVVQWHVNSIHHVQISSVYHLDGYTGPRPFVLSHSQDDERDPVVDEPWDKGLIDKDDGAQYEVLQLGDLLDNLTIN